MWSQVHSHAVYPAPPPTTWVLLAPAPNPAPDHQGPASEPPNAGLSRGSSWSHPPQPVQVDFVVPDSVSDVKAFAGEVANQLRNTSPTCATNQLTSAVTAAVNPNDDPGLADFRASSARVALAGVSCAILLLLLVSTVTHRWQVQRIAHREKLWAAAAARRHRRRTTRDAVESSEERKTGNLSSREYGTEQEEEIQQRTASESETHDKGTSTSIAVSTATAATTERVQIASSGGEKTDNGYTSENVRGHEGNNLISSSEQRFINTNSDKAGRYSLVRRRHVGPTYSAASPRKVRPVASVPSQLRLQRLRTDPNPSVDDDVRESAASEGQGANISDESYAAEASSDNQFFHLSRNSNYRRRPVDRLQRRRTTSKLSRVIAPNDPHARQRMVRARRSQHVLLDQNEEAEESAVEARNTETNTADSAPYEEAQKSESPRRETVKKEGSRRKFRSRRGNRSRLHRRRGRANSHGGSAAREGTWGDGEYERERSFFSGVLHRLLMLSALPAFTR